MIELTADEWRAVDTPVFQRLRSIRQLAMTHLVYPGAVHTRFEHSIGVRYVAGRLAAKLKFKTEQAQVIRAAALLHDIGHGVFSHVSEQVIDERAGVDGVHEAVSVKIMRTDPQLRSALGEEVCDQAADIVELRGTRSASSDIVSGPTDADKLDYLLRDSYFAGVNYGRYDLGRIIDSARIIAPRSAQTQLGFDADGLWAVEELLMARHHMHRQVYGHKTRLATDIMITRALKLGIEAGVIGPTGYTVAMVDGQIDISEQFLEAYLEQTDARVLDQLLQAPADSAVHDLAERLRCRSLLRQTVSIRLDQRVDELGDTAFADIRDPEVFTRQRIAELEAEIADGLGLPAHLVAIYLDTRTNPTYRNPGRPPGRKDIMLQRGTHSPLLLQRESEIFHDQVGPDHTWIYLYTPRLDDEANSRAEELLWNSLNPA